MQSTHTQGQEQPPLIDGPFTRSIDAELKGVYNYLQAHTATATMVAVALNIYRPNLCRRKRALEKAGLLKEIKKGYCEITKCRAAYLTTNTALFNNCSHINLLNND